MKKLFVLLLVVIMVASVMFGCAKEPAEEPTQAPAQSDETTKPEEPAEKFVLKFNHVLTDKDPYHGALLKWADAVAEKTNGGLTIEVYHSAQLGVEEDIIEQIKAGANIGQNTDSARLGNYVPEIAVMNGPYFADSLEEVEKLNTLDTVKEWKRQLAEEHGLKVLSFSWVQGFRNLITNKPIYSPADCEGLLVRSPNAPIWLESIRSLGCTPVALAYGEVYTGIQSKVVDGCGNVYPATYSTKLYEVCDYLSETQHIMLINFEVISAEWFNNLPEEYQVILEEECEKAGVEVSKQIMGELAEDAKAKLIEEGMTIIPHDEIDIDAFKAASDSAYETLGLLEVRDQIFAEMGK
jgi:TRAP-type C4-dicarboxylate transport system substrate-binding protein